VGARQARTGYEYENLDGPDFLKTPWLPPNVLRAREHYRMMLFENGAMPVYQTTISQLSVLGVGVSLHFRVIKYLVWLFLLLTAASVPIFVLCFVGTRLNDDEMDPLRVAAVSIANVGDRSKISDYSISPWRGATLRYSSRQISAIIMACDLAMITFFFAFVIFLHWRIRAIAEEVDANNITASDYAVFVQGLPKTATEAEVRKHFSDLYNLRAEDWTHQSDCKSCCWAGRKVVRRRKFNAPPPRKAGEESVKKRPTKPISQLRVSGCGPADQRVRAYTCAPPIQTSRRTKTSCPYWTPVIRAARSTSSPGSRR